MQQVNYILILSLCFLISSGSKVKAQNFTCDSIYVWNIVDKNNKNSYQSKLITNEIEETLSDIGCLVLDRRNYSEILEHLENEKALLSLNNLSEAFTDTLKLIQAKKVVLGTIDNDFSFNTLLKVEVKDINSSEVKSFSILFRIEEFKDWEVRKSKIRESLIKIFSLHRDTIPFYTDTEKIDSLIDLSKEIYEISSIILLKNQKAFLDFLTDDIGIDSLRKKVVFLFHFQEFRGAIGIIDSKLSNLKNYFNEKGNYEIQMKVLELEAAIRGLRTLLYDFPAIWHYGETNFKKSFIEALEKQGEFSWTFGGNIEIPETYQPNPYGKYGLIELIDKIIQVDKSKSDTLTIIIESYLEALRKYNEKLGSIYGSLSISNR